MKTYQIAAATHYQDEATDVWHYSIAAFGTYREMQAEMRTLKTVDYPKETWRKADDTWGFTNKYVTRTFRIEKQ